MLGKRSFYYTKFQGSGQSGLSAEKGDEAAPPFMEIYTLLPFARTMG